MYTLYENPDAVDWILKESRQAQPEMYLRQCGEQEEFFLDTAMGTTRQTNWMSLPCSNATDARSRVLAVLEPGQKLEATGSIVNTKGSVWYQITLDGKTGYVYAGDLKPWSWLDQLRSRLNGI